LGLAFQSCQDSYQKTLADAAFRRRTANARGDARNCTRSRRYRAVAIVMTVA